MKKIKGSCLCKSISFEIINECRYSVLCHCTMCQKSNAEFSNYTKVQKNNFKFLSKKNLKWFFSSKNFKRGFCNNCGSSYFFNLAMQMKPLLYLLALLTQTSQSRVIFFIKIKNLI